MTLLGNALVKWLFQVQRAPLQPSSGRYGTKYHSKMVKSTLRYRPVFFAAARRREVYTARTRI